MYIIDVTLKNVRKFEHRTFSFQPGFNLLVGENGAGKTTLLRSILAIFANSHQARQRSSLGEADVKLHSMELRASARIASGTGEVYGTAHYQRHLGTRASRMPLADAPPILWYGSNEATCKSFVGRRVGRLSSTSDAGSADMEKWLYDQRGAQSSGRSTRPNFGHSGEINRFLVGVLSKFSSGFEEFVWSFEPYKCKLVRRQKDVSESISTSRNLENAIMRHFLESGNPFQLVDEAFVEIDSDGFLVGERERKPVIPSFRELLDNKRQESEGFFDEWTAVVHLTPRIRIRDISGNSFLLSQLSDGEQRLFSLFVDIARQLSLQSARTIRFDQASAVVLIDEIDVHLHPKWQRMIVPALEDIFPACQFIATTHSPFVVQATREDKVQHLNQDLLGGFSDRGIEEIAVKVMNIDDPEVSFRYLEMLDAAKAYFSELDKIESDSRDDVSKDQRLRQLARLKIQMERLARKYAWNPAYQAYLEVRTELELKAKERQ